MRIDKDTIDKIFEASRIEEVVGDFVSLKRRGTNMLGHCPFHNEKTPSFMVSPAKGIYKCFGCGKGGNSVNFIMDHEQLSYPEALRYLAKKYHIEVAEQEFNPEELKQQTERESLFIVSNFAQDFFISQLWNTDEGKSVGLSYFKERGFTQETIEKFKLGYSPEAREALTQSAQEAGYQSDYLVKTGLTISNERGHYDRFWSRVMFPIHNITGRVIGFGGRTLRSDKKIAKYVNSPESEIYHKSKVLYGLYFAKKAIVQEDNCYMVEGYTDVISLHQAGIENVVSSSGTSLTVEQIRLVRRYTPNLTILYDGDWAGIKASFRGIDLVLEEGMNVKVLLFPDGEDPDSFAKKTPVHELREFIRANSQDFIRFKTNLLIKEVGDDPIKRAELIKDIVHSISLIPDPITRSVYIRECSRIMDMTESVLLQELNKLRGKRLSQHTQDVPSAEHPELPPQEELESTPPLTDHDIDPQEMDLIRLLVSYSTHTVWYEQEDKKAFPDGITLTVAEAILHEVEFNYPEFKNPLAQKIISYFRNELRETRIPDSLSLVQNPDAEISNLAVSMLASPYTLSDWDRHGIIVKKEETKLETAVAGACNALKLRYLQNKINEHQLSLQHLQENEKADFEQQMLLMEEIHKLEFVKKEVSKFLGRIIIK